MRTSLLFLAALACLIGVANTDIRAQGDPTKKSKKAVFQPKLPFSGPVAATPKPMRWEYRVESTGTLTKQGNGSLEMGLNKLGAEGWELTIETSAKGKQATLIFRRPLMEKRKPNAGAPPAPAPKEKAEPRLELRIYRLKNVSAVDMAPLLQDVLRISNFTMRIVAEPMTNQLIVNGPMEAQFAIESLITRLDDDGGRPAPAKKKSR